MLIQKMTEEPVPEILSLTFFREELELVSPESISPLNKHHSPSLLITDTNSILSGTELSENFSLPCKDVF